MLKSDSVDSVRRRPPAATVLARALNNAAEPSPACVGTSIRDENGTTLSCRHNAEIALPTPVLLRLRIISAPKRNRNYYVREEVRVNVSLRDGRPSLITLDRDIRSRVIASFHDPSISRPSWDQKGSSHRETSIECELVWVAIHLESLSCERL